jgi:flagellar hook-associated protein 2
MAIRLGGLASGMDIDSIVRDMMRVERIRVDKVSQKNTQLEWTREGYNEVNKWLAEFVLKTRESFGLTDSSSGVLLNRSVSSMKWVKAATAADPGIVEVSARSNAVNSSYDINVVQLAANWSAASKEPISAEGADRGSLRSQFQLSAGDVIDFTIKTQNTKGEEQTVNIFINDEKTVISITKDGKELPVIELSGKNLSNISLKEIAGHINQADIGVTAMYDESIDRFFLQTNETGEKNTIEITDNSSILIDQGGSMEEADFISRLKLQYRHTELSGDGSPVETAKDVAAGQIYTGKDAVIDFGMAKGIRQSSNQFTINNIDINLKAAGSTTIKVETDENSVIDKITEFVNQYNELIDKINAKLGEARYREYPPLTEEQKKEMTDREIELWEEKAKSGLLRNDQVISSTMQRIRSGLYEKVEGIQGAFSHLTQIGISTESYASGSMGGRLSIDEVKLREALRKDIDGVIELLFKEPDSGITDENEKRQNTGLAGRLYGDLVTGMKEIIIKAGPGEDASLFRKVNSTMLVDFVTQHSSISMLDETIKNNAKRILELERRLADKENDLWRRFSAMEKALNEMYAQSDWLYQQFYM